MAECAWSIKPPKELIELIIAMYIRVVPEEALQAPKSRSLHIQLDINHWKALCTPCIQQREPQDCKEAALFLIQQLVQDGKVRCGKGLDTFQREILETKAKVPSGFSRHENIVLLLHAFGLSCAAVVPFQHVHYPSVAVRLSEFQLEEYSPDANRLAIDFVTLEPFYNRWLVSTASASYAIANNIK